MKPISIEALYDIYKKHPSVSTDTRQVKSGDLFFALKGPNFNGNQFAKQAIDAGAAYALVDEAEYANDTNILYTDDCLSTLQSLAKHHRQQFDIPVLAITGSNGKTTTKELIHAVLSEKYKTYTTSGNLNNHIGVPLTLLKIKDDAEIAVVEMGANHQKEIAAYCSYTLPTHGLITNAGKAHLEGFGGVEGVRKGKGELFDFLRSSNGVAFACSDFEYFNEMTEGLASVHWYGTKSGEITGIIEQSQPFLDVKIEKGFEQNSLVSTQLVGGYNVFNVLAACTVAKYFGVPFEKIKAAIEKYQPSNHRSQLLEKDGNKIILDAYNANPSSMQVAIENFATNPSENKILFLGAMMELGKDSVSEHENLLALIGKYNWKNVVLVGGDFAKTTHPYLFFPDASAAASWWKLQQETGNYLLVKGSRSIKMEQIIL